MHLDRNFRVEKPRTDHLGFWVLERPVSQQLNVDPHGCLPEKKVLRDHVDTTENMVSVGQEEMMGANGFPALLLPIPRCSFAGRADCLDQMVRPLLSINFLICTVS